MKRLLVIPVLIIAYIILISMISEMGLQESLFNVSSAGDSMQTVNIGQSIGVSVRRPFLFGLAYLPVYSESLGYLGDVHNAFFVLVFILTIALIIQEFRNSKEIKGVKPKPQRKK